MFRVSDWIAEIIYDSGARNVHGLMGGGAAALNDGFIKHGKIKYICYHHEQAAGHAAIGESKFTGNLSFVNPTTGCGGTNCITSVLNAWQDSVPVFFLSGNVSLETCSSFINRARNVELRTYGTQEHNIVETVKSITKFAKFVEKTEHVPEIFFEAMQVAQRDRPGPVWVDIPSNIQASSAKMFIKTTTESKQKVRQLNAFEPVDSAIKVSNRPLVIAGGGIRQANSVVEFKAFIEKHDLPYVSSYAARDYLPHDHKLNIGTIGIKGSRAGNFAAQNSDLLIILGCRLSSSVIGYSPVLFSPHSKKIIVDIDQNELKKGIIDFDQKLNVDLKSFFRAMV